MYKRLAENKIINKFLLLLTGIFVLNSKTKKKVKNDIKNIYRNSKKKELADFIKNKYADCFCIFSRYGIGDVFYTASLLKEFKQKNNGAKVIYFTGKSRLVKFLKAFPSIDEVVFYKDIKFLQDEQFLQQNLQKGKLNKLFFPYRGIKETYTFSDNYANLLDVSLEAQRELPVISALNNSVAAAEIERLCIEPSKTVLIIPDATMFDYKVIDSSFWISLANNLKKLGYDIVFNTKLREYKNFKNSFLPVMDFLAFTKTIKHVISFRSGISDLLAGTGILNLTVIYPPNLEVSWADNLIFRDLHKNHVLKYDTEFENIFNIHSLNANFRTDCIQEIIYDYNDSDIIQKIMSNIF